MNDLPAIPVRHEEILRNRKAVLWRVWEGHIVKVYRVAGLNGENARMYVGLAAWDDAQLDWATRARKRRIPAIGSQIGPPERPNAGQEPRDV